MKKLLSLVLAVLLTIGMLIVPAVAEDLQAQLDAANAKIADLEAALENAPFDPSKLIDWYNESDLWRTVKTGAWSTDAADQITDGELDRAFSMAAKQQTAAQFSNTYYIVIKDPEAQRDAMVAADAANRAVFVGEGTVTILVLEDQNHSEEEGHVSPYREKSNFYMPNPWRYHNSGLSSGLLGVALASMGYYTHYYAGVNGPNAIADITLASGGTLKSMSYYVKEEYMRAMGVSYSYDDAEIPEDSLYPVLGNCTLIGAIVVGKPNPDEPIETTVSNYGRPYNYAIWDND